MPPVIPDLPPVHESLAFKQLRQRPKSELSKMLYLIERFKNMNAEVQYNSGRYKIKDISILIQGFILVNFDRKGTAKDWVIQNASYSRTKRNPIWVYLPDGSHCLAKDLLLQELETLEKLV